MAEPSTYLHVAIGFFAVCFYLACYLAWNQERTISERWERDLALVGELLGEPTITPWDVQGKDGGITITGASMFNCRVSVRNTGRAPTVARSWRLKVHLEIPFKFESSIADPTDLEWLKSQATPLKTMADMPIRNTGPIAIGDEWRATLHFTTMFTPERLKLLRVEVQFEDIRGGQYAILYGPQKRT